MPQTPETATSAAVVIKSLSIPMHPVSSVEVAELTKIVENAHRYLQIAFAEELYLYCKSNSISFSQLCVCTNTKWNVEGTRTKRWDRRSLSSQRYKDVC